MDQEIEEAKKIVKKKMTKEQKEEARQRKKEMERIHGEIERIKREKGGEFEYEKSDSDSENRFKR